MNYFIKLFIAIVVAGLIAGSITHIFNFLSVPVSIYGLYLLWFIALLLLSFIIPKRNKFV